MAASLTAPKVTRMCPSPMSASQLAGDRGEALLAGVLGRLVVALNLDQAVADRPQGRVELGGVLVPAILQRVKAGGGRSLPGPHQGIEACEQVAELRLNLGVDVIDMLGSRLHGGELRTEVRTGSAHVSVYPPFERLGQPLPLTDRFMLSPEGRFETP